MTVFAGGLVDVAAELELAALGALDDAPLDADDGLTDVGGSGDGDTDDGAAGATGSVGVAPRAASRMTPSGRDPVQLHRFPAIRSRFVAAA